MKILAVVSGLDFINYTRRATIEAIHKLNPGLEILMFNSFLNIRKKKNVTAKIRFHYYHFWVVEKARKVILLKYVEYLLRYMRWNLFFKRYDVVFLIDPNQYYLLPYISRKQKLVYLVRDPILLIDPGYYSKEKAIIKRADLVLGISNGLCTYYFEKYYGSIPGNVKLWPNTVDPELWDYERWSNYRIRHDMPVVGLAGNINFVIDINLLNYVASNCPGINFEIAGKLDLSEDQEIAWNKLVSLPNVKYLGFIQYDKFPAIAINWDAALVAARKDHEYSKYLNNNKQYQYAAFGKPFVTYHHSSSYEVFEDLVFVAADENDYIIKLKEALGRSKTESLVAEGQKIASANSSKVRAEEFLSYIEGLR